MIDFFSDTKTKPTAGMRAAIAAAEVGDEQKGEDPTTTALCERVADLLGKESAVFLPSGTMCNEIALNVHCRPGDEVICEAGCHIINYEAGGPAALSGVMLYALEGDRGRFTAAQVRDAYRPPGRYSPASRLVCVEQTANLAGGAVWPVSTLGTVAEVARAHGLATHMDGARLMNAVVASGMPARQHASGYDSCWLDFSKGLGAPVGAVLAGDREFIEQAWRRKQSWGGAMRQSGILAAACLYALDHHVDRLADDHRLAAYIAGRLQATDGIVRVTETETNIVFFDVDTDRITAPELEAKMEARGIQIGAFTRERIRVVTHLDVDQTMADRLCDALAEELAA